MWSPADSGSSNRGYSKLDVVEGLKVEASLAPYSCFILNRFGDLIIVNPERCASGRALTVLGNPDPAVLVVNFRRDFPGGVEVQSGLRVMDDLEVRGTLHVRGSLLVSGELVVEKGLRATADVEVGGSLDVAGRLSAAEQVTRGGAQVGGALTVGGACKVFGPLQALDSLQVGKGAQVDGPLRAMGDLDVGGAAHVAGDLVVDGRVFSQRLDARNLRLENLPPGDGVACELVAVESDSGRVTRVPRAEPAAGGTGARRSAV